MELKRLGDYVIIELDELPPEHEFKENEYPKLFINKMYDGSGYRISWEESPWQRSSLLIAKKSSLKMSNRKNLKRPGPSPGPLS